MQKNCKKMQKYLHMSKKSSTFVADLGIVPAITNKYNESMEKECIFRCQRNGRTYRVIAVPNEKTSRGMMYFAYIGRRRLEPMGWYNPEFAIDSVLCDAFGPRLWCEVKGTV